MSMEMNNENMRFISTKDLKVLGKGASAVIYELNENQVLKEYFKNFTKDMILEENRLTNAVYQAGIPTMKAYDVVKTDDYLGGVYERLYAKDLIQCMKEDKRNLQMYAQRFGEFVRKAHQVILPKEDFADGRELMLKVAQNRDILNINEEEQKKLIGVISTIPVCDNFSHGDCHVGNVMLREDSLLFIDVGRVTRASAYIDFVSMFSIYRLTSYHGIHNPPVVSPNAAPFTEEECEIIWDTYLRSATGIEDEATLQEIERQINVVTATRMLQIRTYNPNFFPQEIFDMFLRDITTYYDEGLPPFIEIQ